MISGKKRMLIKDRLVHTAGKTVAWYIAMAAGVISGTLAIVDDVLDISTGSRRPTQPKDE